MKAQAAVEFFILISIMLIITSIFLISGFSLQGNLLVMKLNKEAQEITDSAAFEINSAVQAGNGYSRKFYLEENFGYDYVLRIEGYAVVMSWNGRTNVAKILTNTINGNLGKGWNRIRNIQGVIYID
jgi:hypothetical protein